MNRVPGVRRWLQGGAWTLGWDGVPGVGEIPRVRQGPQGSGWTSITEQCPWTRMVPRARQGPWGQTGPRVGRRPCRWGQVGPQEQQDWAQGAER